MECAGVFGDGIEWLEETGTRTRGVVVLGWNKKEIEASWLDGTAWSGRAGLWTWGNRRWCLGEYGGMRMGSMGDIGSGCEMGEHNGIMG